MATTQIPLNPAEQSPGKSLRAAYAQYVLRQHLLAKLNAASPGHHYDSLPKTPPLPRRNKDAGAYEGRICIIGAGVTGLYLGMMLKYLNITNFDILEGNDRIGGRLYTYPLEKDGGQHRYYDIGAMRVPDLQWMEPGDEFDAFMGPLVEPFTADYNAAFASWMETSYDNYSIRGILMTGQQDQNADAPTVPWTYQQTALAELYDTSTGLFDQAFTEMVIDYADFQAASKGSSTSHAVEKSTPVKALSIWSPNDKISVFFDSPTQGNDLRRDYDMVFNTTAMGPLQKMDLEGLNLDKEILTGIRSLGYDRATKVAIKFSKPWWYNYPGRVYGGISGSDLPIRSVVYPSWNDGPDEPAVLMVSYTWAQDATRMPSIVPVYTAENPPNKSDPIVKLCLENLVKLWSDQANAPTYAQLNSWYIEHHAFAWENDPWTGGAYALYGPAQYKDVYPKFIPLLCNSLFDIGISR